MTYKHDAALKDARILLEVKNELHDATRIQPCPACRHDMEQLGLFLDAKISSMQAASLVDGKMTKILKDVSYINELSSIGISLAKISKPLTKLGLFAVPSAYERVLDKDRAANRIIREHLLIAGLILSKLERSDEQYAAVAKILKSFLKATEFKLSADSQTFFLFDKIIRFCYRTHLLGMTGRIIVGAKNVVSCCINE